MDQLSYTYNDATNNRLHRVADAKGTTQGDDFGGSSSYKYDAIGNLVHDEQEEIESIEWTVSGKVRKVIRMAGSIKPNLEFYYDAMGNRVGKKVINDITKPWEFQLTWYSRDASGNVMATYQSPKKEYSGSQLKLIDISIYGSQRLGVLSVDQKLTDLPEPGAPIKTMEKGNKHFELTNHLGNVLSVISDRLFSTQSTTLGKVARYTADLVSSSDYYPFGMQMPGRKSSTGEYRYGFNGQEKEGDITGSETHNTAEYWMYDTRLGRRWEVDPILKIYESPYACFAGNPIWFGDPNGADSIKLSDGSWGWKVEKGDNPSSISSRTGVGLWDIARNNQGNQEGGGHFNAIGDGNYNRYWVEGKGTEWSTQVGDVLRLNYASETSVGVNSTEANAPKTSLKNSNNSENTNYYGAGVFEYSDELIAGAEAYAKTLKNGGGYVAVSTAKSGNGLYWKPNARGLNNLKGVSVNVSKSLKVTGPVLGLALEAPEIYYGYKKSTHDGNKQVAGAAGSAAGGWLGGMIAGGTAGLVGIETGPGVIVTVIVGAGLGAYYGEDAVEGFYEWVTE